MKALVRLGATLGIASSIFFAGLSQTENLRAVALPQSEVLKKLQIVPVFTLINPKGEFVVISRNNESKTISQVGFFLSKQNAQDFLDKRLKKENPQLASTLQVRPLSLADYYQIVQEAKKKKDSVIYTLVPAQQQLESAKTIMNQNGQKVQQFNGIPLFIPKLDKGYLTIPVPQSKERYVPLYFEKEQAVALLDEFKKAVPQEASKTGIEVAELSGVVETLNTSNDPNMNKFILYPSRESIEFIRSLAPKTSAPNQLPGAKPQTAPTQKK
ncbi:Tic22 family protein [Nostoc sp. NIES-4103]|nr:Tic22 family protein [Nostoc sp. NIES-4103]